MAFASDPKARIMMLAGGEASRCFKPYNRHISFLLLQKYLLACHTSQILEVYINKPLQS